jgi:hypothetical protein
MAQINAVPGKLILFGIFFRIIFWRFHVKSQLKINDYPKNYKKPNRNQYRLALNKYGHNILYTNLIIGKGEYSSSLVRA